MTLVHLLSAGHNRSELSEWQNFTAQFLSLLTTCPALSVSPLCVCNICNRGDVKNVFEHTLGRDDYKLNIKRDATHSPTLLNYISLSSPLRKDTGEEQPVTVLVSV